VDRRHQTLDQKFKQRTPHDPLPIAAPPLLSQIYSRSIERARDEVNLPFKRTSLRTADLVVGAVVPAMRDQECPRHLPRRRDLVPRSQSTQVIFPSTQDSQTT